MDSAPKVLCVGFSSQSGPSIEHDCLARYGIEVVYSERQCTLKDLVDASVVICPSVYELSREVRESLEGKLAICVLSGDAQLDYEIAQSVGCRDCLHVERSYAYEVADSVLSMLLSFVRRLPNPSPSYTCHVPVSALAGVRRTQNLSVGIWGWDKAARLVARRCLAFDLRVRVYDPSLEAGDPLDVTGPPRPAVPLLPEVEVVSDLADFLRSSHVLTLHGQWNAPLITEETLDLLGPSTILINLSPEARMDDLAVKHGLNSGKIGSLAVMAGMGQWDEAWVHGSPNVRVVPPRSVLYSDQGLISARFRASMIALEYLSLTHRVPALATATGGPDSRHGSPTLRPLSVALDSDFESASSSAISPRSQRHGAAFPAGQGPEHAGGGAGAAPSLSKKKKRGSSIARAKTALRQAEARILDLELVLTQAGISVPTQKRMEAIGEEGEVGDLEALSLETTGDHQEEGAAEDDHL